MREDDDAKLILVRAIDDCDPDFLSATKKADALRFANWILMAAFPYDHECFFRSQESR